MSSHTKHVHAADLDGKLLSQPSWLQVSFLFRGCHHGDSYLFYHLLAMGHWLCLHRSSLSVSISKPTLAGPPAFDVAVLSSNYSNYLALGSYCSSEL